MRLSEAMMLGSVTCKMEPGDMNSCAYGAALNAIGVPRVHPQYMRYTPLRENWPWLEIPGAPGNLTNMAKDIYSMFDSDVCDGRKTYEQLVDFVRSIEPSCGDCNRFECTCVRKMDETNQNVTEEVVCTN